MPEPVTLLQAFTHILADQALDKALLVEILTVPSETALAEQFERVDVDAIHLVREHLMKNLAVALQTQWLALYQENHHTGPYSIAADAMAMRALANLALSFGKKADPAMNGLVVAQYEQANNMTDLLAAMQAANVGQLPCLSSFWDFEQNKHEDGSVDIELPAAKVCSVADVLERISKLMLHPTFSLKTE